MDSLIVGTKRENEKHDAAHLIVLDRKTKLCNCDKSLGSHCWKAYQNTNCRCFCYCHATLVVVQCDCLPNEHIESEFTYE